MRCEDDGYPWIREKGGVAQTQTLVFTSPQVTAFRNQITHARDLYEKDYLLNLRHKRAVERGRLP
jgi:hypothetical protein